MPTTLPDWREMTRALIATASVSSTNATLDMSNQGVVDLLAGWLEDAGFGVEVMPLQKQGKSNLIARLGDGDDGLVLAGHTDTVPFDAHAWRYDPFALTEADCRLYGLGSADMKTFLALAVTAASCYRASELRRPLTLLATADEESTMLGARALQRSNRRLGRAAVIGEPTGLRPVRMHKGIFMESVRVLGRSGHSSDPSFGASALEGMHRVVDTLIGWRTELQSTHRNDAFSVPVPTLNLGHIHGGDSANRICAECELHLDLRPLPGMDIDALREELRARVRGCLGGTALSVEFGELFCGIPAMETPADSPLVREAERLCGAPAGAVAFGTEAPHFNRMGMETVVLGPGDIDQAHKADEYVLLERIPRMLELLHALIRRFCAASA